MDGERTVKITEDKENALRYIDDAGVSCTYTLLTSARTTTYLIVNSLSVIESGVRLRLSEEPSQQPTTRRYIRGFGTICDKSLSVIGDPDNKSRRVSLLIHARTKEEQAEVEKKWRQDVVKGGDQNDPSYREAFLDFADEWFLELYILEKTLESLADAILNNQVHSLRVGIGLRNIYTDAGLGELYNDEPVNLFLRPSISEGNVRRPEAAYGSLEAWDLRFSGTVELSDPFENEPISTPEIDSLEETRGPSEVENLLLAALERLTAIVGSIRVTIVWLGWILVVGFLVIAFIS